MAEPFVVLIVCRANVCRSPVAEQVMKTALAAAHIVDVVVGSAGTEAYVGSSACADGTAAVGVDGSHRAHQLNEEMLAEADLVLPVDREARSACAVLLPECRPRLYTLSQAAALAVSVAPTGPAPAEPSDRLRWMVEEWDAGRILLGGRDEQADDISDRHGPDPHSEVFLELQDAVASVVTGFSHFLGSTSDLSVGGSPV